jgi:hypothetical protein
MKLPLIGFPMYPGVVLWDGGDERRIRGCVAAMPVTLPSPAPEQAPSETQRGVHDARPPRVTRWLCSARRRIKNGRRAHHFGSHPWFI